MPPNVTEAAVERITEALLPLIVQTLTDACNSPWDWLVACVTCGRPHVESPGTTSAGGIKRAGSWADPDDGHPYRPRYTRDTVPHLRTEYARTAVPRTMIL